MHEAMLNHKSSIENICAIQTNTSDTIREQSNYTAQLQHRVQILEELVLQLASHTTNTGKPIKPFKPNTSKNVCVRPTRSAATLQEWKRVKIRKPFAPLTSRLLVFCVDCATEDCGTQPTRTGSWEAGGAQPHGVNRSRHIICCCVCCKLSDFLTNAILIESNITDFRRDCNLPWLHYVCPFINY